MVSLPTYTRDRSKRLAIIASVITGTTIEWYDFYLYATLLGTLGPKFFPSKDPLIVFLSSMAAYATGFAIRPVGAVFFGRLGDLKGRKSAFLATLLLMGGATTAIGLLPGYAKVDPVSGTDRFPQNRRVTTATYHLDGSPPVAVRFTDAPDLQWIEVDTETTAVVVEITGTTDAAERDDTAVSEVQFTGWPAG